MRKLILNLPKFAKLIYYLIADNLELILRKRDSIIPPKHLKGVGGGKDEFLAVGKEFLGYLIDIAKLKASDKVLDVGCGSGRMAIPLTKYINTGQYWGFDIFKDGINWCRRNITRKFNNFQFHYVDIYNESYNPKGKIKATEFKFPYKRAFFDFVFLASIFTHMNKKDMENYISEVAHVLKKGGKCLITFFIINDASVKLLVKGSGFDTFTYNKFNNEFLWTIDGRILELGVAYDEKYIRELYLKSNLKIIEPIYYGNWCGREK
jgi:SAM-dependent methyltransferase